RRRGLRQRGAQVRPAPALRRGQALGPRPRAGGVRRPRVRQRQDCLGQVGIPCDDGLPVRPWRGGMRRRAVLLAAFASLGFAPAPVAKLIGNKHAAAPTLVGEWTWADVPEVTLIVTPTTFHRKFQSGGSPDRYALRFDPRSTPQTFEISLNPGEVTFH